MRHSNNNSSQCTIVIVTNYSGKWRWEYNTLFAFGVMIPGPIPCSKHVTMRRL